MNDFYICMTYSAHYLSMRKKKAKKAIRKITDYFNFFRTVETFVKVCDAGKH